MWFFAVCGDGKERVLNLKQKNPEIYTTLGKFFLHIRFYQAI